MALTADQFVSKLRNGSLKHPIAQVCICGKKLKSHESVWTADGYMCEDCYHDVMGELVEHYPISNTRS